MRFVLLNTHQLSEAWLYPYLNDDLHADTKVCIFILEELSAYEEEKEMVEQQFKKGSRNYDALVTPLLTYGIKEDNIIFSYAHDQDAIGKIRGADVLFIYGRKDAYIYLGDELKEEILQFDGLIIGIQLGALIQMDEYYRIEEEEAGFEEGLGLLSGFSLVIDYEQTINQIKGIIRILEDKGGQVVLCPRKTGGLFIDETSLELLGDAFIFDEGQLDELYQAKWTMENWK